MKRLPLKDHDCPLRNEKCDGTRFSLASRECLNLLLRLCFDRDEAWKLLASVSDTPPLDSLRVGAIYRRILKASETDEQSRNLIETSISRKLNPLSPGIEGRPLCDMASIWAKRRDSIDSLSAAAMLWYVARSPLPCWRRLEGHIIDDLYYRSVRALALPTAAPVETEGCSVCSVGGFSL